MRVAIDTGDTFTDCLFLRDGRIEILKLPSTPGNPAKAIANALEKILAVAEIAAHLADVEIAVGFRLRMILGAPGTPIQAYDQDAWVTSGHYEKRDTRKAIEQYRVVREANLALLKSLAPEQWKHHGIHAERGEESIETIVRMIAGHDLNHIQQIERILAQKKA
jgi:hypothetical protein